MLVLRAGALFDGEVRRSGADLLVEDGRVVAVEDSAPPPSDAELVDLGAGVTLLPGLVDAHQHLVMDASAGVVESLERASDDDLLAQARLAAATALAAGVTTVRDLGDRGYVTLALRDELAADPAAGPRLVVSGPPLTTVGGHCWFLGGEVDGAEQVRAAVAERADRGVDVVKVFATGGNLTPGSDPGAAQFAPAELSGAGRGGAPARAAGRGARPRAGRHRGGALGRCGHDRALLVHDRGQRRR